LVLFIIDLQARRVEIAGIAPAEPVNDVETPVGWI
jgi:hypothetical protein